MANLNITLQILFQIKNSVGYILYFSEKKQINYYGENDNGSLILKKLVYLLNSTTNRNLSDISTNRKRNKTYIDNVYDLTLLMTELILNDYWEW